MLNATTKSGSNEWDFGINAYYDDERWETSPNTFAAANDVDEDSRTTFDLYASGPIIQDRLFFYALYSDVKREQRYAGITSEEDNQSTEDEGFWGIKLDGYITPEHHIEYTHFTDERVEEEEVYDFDPNTFRRGEYAGLNEYERGGENWIASYTGRFGPDLELSVSYGENEAARTTSPSTADIPVVYEHVDSRFRPLGDWTNFTVEKGDDKREMLRADITWSGFLGHELSFGIDNESYASDQDTINSGGAFVEVDDQWAP